VGDADKIPTVELLDALACGGRHGIVLMVRGRGPYPALPEHKCVAAYETLLARVAKLERCEQDVLAMEAQVKEAGFHSLREALAKAKQQLGRVNTESLKEALEEAHLQTARALAMVDVASKGAQT
jgi:hypothetical protein